MTLIPIKIPPGMFRNGTPYQAKNRWLDGSLVRWHDGALRPIGGWRLVSTTPAGQAEPTAIVPDPDTNVIRDAHQWRDNAGTTVRVVFSNKGAYYINSSGVVTDITPVGFTGGNHEPSALFGYGTGPYGENEYGVARPSSSGQAIPVYRWSHSLFGEDLLACPAAPTAGGTLYEFDSSGTAKMTPVANAPTDVSGVLVTDERIVMVIGSTAEPRRVRWSSRENKNEWTPAIENEAGGQTLTGNGKLLSVDSVLNQILILSESDAHVARYIGAPFIYGFDRVGDNCGPVSAAAVVTTDRFAMWPSSRSFYMFDGTVRRIECDVMDYLVRDFSSDNRSKMYGHVVPQFNEIWWFYQSAGSTTDVDSYVVFDYVSGHWQTGKLGRTIYFGGVGTQNHLAIDRAAELYEHELAGVRVEGAYAETGPLELGEGDKNMAVRYIFPDTQTSGDVNYTLLGRAMPTEPEYSYGPYPFSNPIGTRAMGREIRMRCDGVNTDWEVGSTTRFDVAPMGTGMR